MTATLTDCRWRHMTAADLPAVLAVQRAGRPDPWPLESWELLLSLKHVWPTVITLGRALLGYLVAECFSDRYRLLDLAVDPAWRRRGAGRLLLERLAARLHPGRRSLIEARVRETNLAAQLFLRALGFVCVGAAAGQFPGGEAAYHFERLAVVRPARGAAVRGEG